VAGARGSYVTEEDRNIATLGHNRIDLYCHGQTFHQFTGQEGVDRAAGYAELQYHLGGNDIAFDVLSSATSTEEAQAIFMNKYGSNWIMRRSALLLIGLAMLLSGGVLYCLKKCRCCAYERPTLEIQKTCVMIIIAVTLVGIAWCSVTAVMGFSLQQEGMQNARCTMARFLDSALLGEPQQGGDTFIGLFPLLRKLEKLERTLDNGTAFDEASKAKILEQTDKLNRAAGLASMNLALLTDELNANKELLINDYFHDCTFCEAVLPFVNNATETMKDSVATRLGQTRAEVERSIQNGGNEQLKQNLKQTTDAVVAWKDLAVNGNRKMYKDGWLAAVAKNEDTLKWVLFAAVLLVSLSAIALIVTATLSVYRFKYHEMKDEEDIEDVGGQVNPYNKLIHQQARRTWCWAFIYVMLALMVSGTLDILSAPFSSFCLLLNDLDGDKLSAIAPGLNMSFENEKGTNWKEIMDKCVQPSDGDHMNSFLLDLLVTKHGDTLKEDLKKNARDAVQSRFSSVVQSTTGSAPPLLQNPVMQKLRQVVNSDVPSMVVGNRLALKNSVLADMKLDGFGTRNLRTGGWFQKLGIAPVMNNSLVCPNYTTPDDLGDFSEITIAGITEFADRLAELGTPSSTGSTCARKVTCHDESFFRQHSAESRALNALVEACKAGNGYLDLKGRLMTEEIYRCNLFTEPGGSGECDPTNMQNQSNTWTGDCMDADGAVAKFERKCDLSKLKIYMKSWDNRLGKTLERADAEVARIRTNVNKSLEHLLGLHINEPIDVLSGGATCNFMSAYFQEGIDSFCYQGVVGTRHITRSYVWCAIWTALLIPTMCGVYCRSKGNYENWSPDAEARTKYRDLQKKQEEAVASLLGKKKKEEPTWFGDPDASRINAPNTAGPPSGRPHAPVAELSESDSE